MNISSGSAFGPIQPQLPDFSALDEKNLASFTPPDSGASGQAINFGNDAMSGTDFSSLTATPDSVSNRDPIQMQGLMQQLGPQIEALLQLLLMLQQLFAGQQQNNSAGAGRGGGADMPDTSAEEGASLTAPFNAAMQQPVNPTESASAQRPLTASTMPQPGTASDAALNTPARQTPASGGVPLIKGESGLHLPAPLLDHEQAIMRAAKETNQAPEVLAAQIWQESRGKTEVTTVNGGNGLSDSGLMQVNSNTFADLQSRYPHLLGPDASASSPEDSIMAGALYLKEQREAFGGDPGAGLRAYNSGPGNVNVNDLTDISKTGTGDPTYVGKVLNFADIISSGKGTLPA
ncbi:transglycosylase SLT domain-containing protein [Pantoea agglomerans]|uniref:transglycosylase SLT domain-containing protein n=1 Tax=Enterobacter agglomerans TaxID=549 RepID=UPI000DAC15AD|nr:transglycosylase SLT domain-containing protein [Pantoea agglomerans]RAH33463.1 lytic transglycosylase domain-containing protein [Pantoea agglomerans]TGX93693.1 lytic transglycosylase domain-containing protein [Pantoea agglomerans]